LSQFITAYQIISLHLVPDLGNPISNKMIPYMLRCVHSSKPMQEKENEFIEISYSILSVQQQAANHKSSSLLSYSLLN
jgi:hypothetical protein